MAIELPKLKKVDANKPKKKKVLLLSDDMRLHSGVGTMSKELVMNSVHKYDWCQIGGAIKHPDQGKRFDLSADTAKETGVEDVSCIVYAHSGYGNPQVLNELMQREKPDAILHFTDPRFWGWLYNIEHQIRQKIPIMYYNIWDDLPYPHWNEPFYESCDMILNISRQTQNIVKNVLQKFPKPDWAVQWVPHGINEKYYYPITELHSSWEEYDKWQKQFKLSNDVDFVVFWTNRNIRRKQPGDVILAFKHFCDQLPKEKAEKCALFMHTQISDANGTDLMAVKKALCPRYKVIFSGNPVNVQTLNYYYNIADITVNIAS